MAFVKRPPRVLGVGWFAREQQKEQQSMKQNVVIYHRADFDGIFCREIARKALGESAEYIGWDYGEPEPVIHEATLLYILDLSVPSLMNHPKLIWIDHHKSAIEKYSMKDGKPWAKPGIQVDGVAACRLAWQWFFPVSPGAFIPNKQEFVDRTVPEPWAVRLAGEYDIWDKRDPRAETFQFGLRSGEPNWSILLGGFRKPSIEEIERMMDAGFPLDLRPDGTIDESTAYVEGLLHVGRTLQTYQREQDAGVVKRGFEVDFEGRKFLALNTARCNSLTFEASAQPHHDGLMGFYWDGRQWKVSLYHSPHHKEHDLSAIAVKFGGGGHRGACGFVTHYLPFVQPIPDPAQS